MTNKTFLGSEISQYGIDNNRVDYAALASTYQHICCSDKLFSITNDWEIVNGEEYYYCEGSKRYSSDERNERVDELQEEIDTLNDRKYTYIAMLDETDSLHKIKRLEALIEAVDDRISEYENIISELDKEIYDDVFSYYIIDESGVRILQDYTNELVYYSAKLETYIWGFKRNGTSWSYLLTSIEIDAA